MAATIVYEDSAAKQADTFGPHNAVLWAAILKTWDWQTPEQPYKLFDEAMQTVLAHPVKGNGNMIPFAKRKTKRAIALVYDEDRVRLLFDLSPGASIVDVVSSVRQAVGAEGISVLFFVRNMESIVGEAAAQLGLAAPPKNPVERDRILGKLTYEKAGQLRALYEAKELGFHEVVDFAAQFLKPPVA